MVLRRTLRAGLRLARRGPLRRRLSRLPYRPAAGALCWGIEVVRWRGVDVAVNPGEAHGFHVYFLGDYGQREIDACIDLCRGARWFADVGANVGLVSLAVARAVPNLQVMAVEPEPALCEWLAHNLTLNPDLAPRVHIVRAAATDRDGPVRFAPSRTPLNAGTGHIVDADSDGTREVAGIAIGAAAAALGRTLDVVKIDVEGAELAALRGVWPGGALPRGIVIETHGFTADDPLTFNRTLLDELTSHGYQVDYMRRDGWARVNDATDVGPRGHLRASHLR
jgi:FkbM family methyltransferase